MSLMLRIMLLPETFYTEMSLVLHSAVLIVVRHRNSVALLLADAKMWNPCSKRILRDTAGPQKLPILCLGTSLVQVMSGLWLLLYFTYTQALLPLFCLLGGRSICQCQPTCLGPSRTSSRNALIPISLPVQVLMSWSRNYR